LFDDTLPWEPHVTDLIEFGLAEGPVVLEAEESAVKEFHLAEEIERRFRIGKTGEDRAVFNVVGIAEEEFGDLCFGVSNLGGLVEDDTVPVQVENLWTVADGFVVDAKPSDSTGGCRREPCVLFLIRPNVNRPFAFLFDFILPLHAWEDIERCDH
jgi:hypothetical protein